jgi:hypothetical protein
MQSPDKHYGIGSVMDIDRFRFDLDLVPTDHRERNSWPRNSVIP